MEIKTCEEIMEPECTCRNLRECGDDFTCSECGYRLGYTNIEFAYCPNCGAKVVEDED